MLAFPGGFDPECLLGTGEPGSVVYRAFPVCGADGDLAVVSPLFRLLVVFSIVLLHVHVVICYHDPACLAAG